MARHAGDRRVAVTGAAGFIGRTVVERIERGALGPIAELRLNDLQAFEHPSAAIVQGSYAELTVRRQLIGDGVDVLFHLASVPGGASERDPVLGRRVNLDGTLALLDAAAETGVPTVVYASTIAVLDKTDAVTVRPTGSYGTHKAMIELYLADLTRRGRIDGRAVRPSGIVARPREAFAGFATAWMSDLFHAALDRRAIAIPARPDTQVWLQSVDAVADNIVHAALMPAKGLHPARAWTLPATVVRVDALVDALGQFAGHAMQVDYSDGPIDQPAMDASAASAVGFVSDGSLDALVDAVMRRVAGR